jgi:hypothetical protein
MRSHETLENWTDAVKAQDIPAIRLAIIEAENLSCRVLNVRSLSLSLIPTHALMLSPLLACLRGAFGIPGLSRHTSRQHARAIIRYCHLPYYVGSSTLLPDL